MHSKINNPDSLDSYFSGIRDLLPAVDRLVLRHETTKLRDYVEAMEGAHAARWQSSHDFVTEVSNYTRNCLGAELGTAIGEELHELPQVLTANHHGIDTFAQSTQSNLLFSLRKRAGGGLVKTIPVLACGSVPMNNLTYPRGLLIYASDDAAAGGGAHKLPIFPDSHKRKLVSVAKPFDSAMLDRARGRAKKMADEEKLIGPIQSALTKVFDDFDQIGGEYPGYASQATVVNNRLWQLLFRGRACHSDLVYIELEHIAARLLQRDLFDRETICHQLLFDPELRGRLIEKLDGQRGCWQFEELSRRVLDSAGADGSNTAPGTMFFWGVDAKGRQVPLGVVDPGNGNSPDLSGVDDSGNTWTIPLTPEAIARGLNDLRLLPSIFTSYLLISFARGVRCIGGYYQADYLPIMRRAVVETLSSAAGGADEHSGNDTPGPDPYLSGMQAVGFRTGNRLLPAGPLEIIASGGFDDEHYERLGEVTVFDAHIASMFDFVMDVAPRNHDLDWIKRDLSQLVHDRVGDKILTISMDNNHDSR